MLNPWIYRSMAKPLCCPYSSLCWTEPSLSLSLSLFTADDKMAVRREANEQQTQLTMPIACADSRTAYPGNG